MPQKKKATLPNISKGVVSKVNNYASKNASFRAFCDHVAMEHDYYVMQSSRSENRSFDESWIHELETGFNSIDRILANPRSFIKESPRLVLAGKAKKINSKSITHLASHTQFVRGVDEDDNIIPDKILNIDSDVDIQIYENRILMTLIGKLSTFVQRRYTYIKEHGETRNSDVLLVHSVNEVDGLRYEVDTRIKVSVPSEDEGKAAQNHELEEKIRRLRDRVTYYMNSKFMKEMKGAKAVKNPLAMTNLLMKNPDYHAVVVLWKFLDSYTKLGIEFDINDSRTIFTSDYLQEITNMVSLSMLTLRSNSLKGHSLELKPVLRKHLAPKVLLSLEDETFLFGPFHDWTFAEYSLDLPKNNEPLVLSREEVRNLETAYKEAIKEEATHARLISDEIAEQNAEQALRERDELLRLRREKAEEEELLRLEEEAKRQAYEEYLMKRLEEREAAYDLETKVRETLALEETRNAVLKDGVGVTYSEKHLPIEEKQEENAFFSLLGDVPSEAYPGPIYIVPSSRPSALEKSYAVASLSKALSKPFYIAFYKPTEKERKPSVRYFAVKNVDKKPLNNQKKQPSSFFLLLRRVKGERQ